jgi:hypothetical protein
MRFVYLDIYTILEYNKSPKNVSKKSIAIASQIAAIALKTRGEVRILKLFLISLVLVGFVCLMASPASAATPVALETFTGAGTASVNMPGSSNPPYVEFNGQIIAISSADFASGSVMFNGVPIDFDGFETDIMSMSSTYTGGVRIENLPGQIVNGYVYGLVDGGGQHYEGSGSTNDLSLGGSFSVNSLDLTVNSTFQSTCETPDFHCEAIPELEGVMMRTTSSTTITSVDAANGVLDASVSGTIYAITQIPVLTKWGFVVLALGVIGMGILILQRRRKLGFMTV